VPSDGTRARLLVAVRGAVQGVGFRPFVYRLAEELSLTGWVQNSPAGVELEVEGERAGVARFLLRLEAERPPLASIQGVESRWLEPHGATTFEIRPSAQGGESRALVLPDIATCADCRAEIFDPTARRHRYPFTNCTNCGPRYSIIEGLPYDRAKTTMRRFTMCEACRAEYEDPRDRRFHAQPIACFACGPRLRASDGDNRELGRDEAALATAVRALSRGEIVALKGLGGYQLLVDARDEAAVLRLRARKRREAKPFAVMAPTLQSARALASIAPLEARLLEAPEAPIVLLAKTDTHELAEAVAPRNPQVGVMLPYTPLHHLLLRELDFPVVATSGNASEEPIAIDDEEARARLGGIADLWLAHDRPIARPVDDSVARVILGREQVLRRARGYAPLPVRIPTLARPTLAVGAQLKNAIALGFGETAFVSQHIGDLENRATEDAFGRTIDALASLYNQDPSVAIADLHPDYLSTRMAEARCADVERVQHHHAHVAAAMLENEIEPPCLGVAWDGTGLGLDGSIWGGEFFRVRHSGYERFASLRPFRLPGGDAAVREPRRVALALLYELRDPTLIDSGLAPFRSLPVSERAVLLRMLERGVQSPWTTSAGRLFDGIAALLDLAQITRFEGEAAMALEFEAARSRPDSTSYPLPLRATSASGTQAPRFELNWEPMLRALLSDLSRGEARPTIARRAHLALVEGIVAVARASGEAQVVLGGGCFQNRILTEESVTQLEAQGFGVAWPQRIPPNDGGIALGQIAVALQRRAQPKEERACASPSPAAS